MGNCRFKFSDMIPNSWFFKLKYTSRTRNQKSMQKPTKKKNQPNTKSSPSSSSQSSLSPSSVTPAPAQPHHLSHQRKSYHFTRDLRTPHPPSPDNNSPSQFSDPSRQSSKKSRSIKKNRPSNGASPRQLVTSSVSADCSSRPNLESVWTKPDWTPEEYPLDSCSSEDDDSMFPELGSENENGEPPFDKMVSWSNSCHCRVKSDILIDMSNDANFKKLSGFDSNSQFELPPIITKTDKSEKNEAAARIKAEERSSYIISSTCSKEQRIISPVRKLTVNDSLGVKLRSNSPRLARNRFLQVHGRKRLSSSGGGTRRSLSESFAVVKSSQDPHRDFKESMVEMIMENNMRTSKDLEDLLACYLSLNSDKYHDLIIKVFKQIWLEITDIRLK